MALKLCQLPLSLLIIGLAQLETFVGGTTGVPRVPCYFIFGDSLVDCGNNNDLETAAKANYAPYGMDFPTGANGRFTNGLTIADLIGQLLGFDHFIPSYASARDEEISSGVNYGSGSAGIREETGKHLGDRVCMDRQLRHHERITSRIRALQQNKTFTNEHLKECIYIVNMGNNDYINNYLMPQFYKTSHKYRMEQYSEVLAEQYTKQLKKLYRLGARRIAVFGLGMLGCAPALMQRFETNGTCVDWINDAVMLFNNRLHPLVEELNYVYPNARFTFINLTNILAPKGGEPLPNKPCCPVRPDGQCVPNGVCCPSRSLSVYIDSFHPTEIANILLATRAYKAQSNLDVYPMDIGQLTRDRFDA
ncbi:hypothetical protein M8C21_026581 [Ambrosia artemisiifolia]|uniref:Uncharacterized protein n=1 Tax=Ambrosia artemisiifolia TaxID=4212 RepID=A0AAD5GGM0_AMBAR|nr:hypothetical protein M8C21_026581 [Ambrosia artemisiifolia]